MLLMLPSSLLLPPKRLTAAKALEKRRQILRRQQTNPTMASRQLDPNNLLIASPAQRAARARWSGARTR